MEGEREGRNGCGVGACGEFVLGLVLSRCVSLGNWGGR